MDEGNPWDSLTDLQKSLVIDDYCPWCLGELDTGFECNDCGRLAKSCPSPPKE